MNKDKFLEIIEATPLVSIDLIVKNNLNQILLGRRNNKPAQGYWFVPGGRIRKNETLNEAFHRISTQELGISFEIRKAKLLGAYDHIYTDNFHSEAGINTHYVALGHQIALPNDARLTIDEQHSDIKWWNLEELLSSSSVHDNTKNYFR